MKNILLYICLLCSVLSYAQDCQIQPFDVALADASRSDTNVRDQPNGSIILKLSALDEFVLHVIDYKDDWLKINKVSSVYNGYEISQLEGWIHQSTVGFWTRKKIDLLTTPVNGDSVGVIEVENGPVKIKDICDSWIKIEFNGLIGWVELEWLCGNPVTTCP